ncbi:venom serine carboxypeptidase-like [Leguminivora glycinivorella]|uniref:venom serine carboxypeptidase-like n=1 Tax=Leguminivora glycinivorella TaxID=1035111 RepID=UPI00200D5E79|nr:venom serine carboxypeptidase-like [Leguminivora glycinivorella]
MQQRQSVALFKCSVFNKLLMFPEMEEERRETSIYPTTVPMLSLLLETFAWASLLCLQDVTGARLLVTDNPGPGEPLFLTPYIERGDIKEARRLARVTVNDSLNVESYAGFFTVNKAYDSNQFFWYFPSMSSDKDKAPVLVWLQGGPGGSSLIGLFCENGPIKLVNGQFERRKYHWALNHHVIYIDNPVGAGFSFTNNEKGYCTDETQVGEQLYSTLTQFFQLFPELQKNDFFITGESYAGKFVPALAYTIMKKESTAKLKVNLKGLVIGGAWINPESQQNWDQFNCSDVNERKQLFSAKATIKSHKREKWFQGNVCEFLPDLSNATRKAIHVGDLSYSEFNNHVFDKMSDDFCESMAPWLSEIVEVYPVTLYGGQNDTIVHYDGIVDFLRNHFNFSGADEYRSAKQYEWRVGGAPAGCVRRARRLTELLVLDAEHLVPRDQPERAWDLITRVTSGKGFEQEEICSTPTGM